MNINMCEVINGDNPNDYPSVEFPAIKVESSKYNSSITLTQDGNTINFSSLQTSQLRNLLIQIFD